jgi:2-iminobutanoate/2-iminopropanoate deaminase
MYFILQHNMKNLFLIFLLIFSIPAIFCQDIIFVNSELHLENDAPFSEATIVNGIIYLSGEIGTLPNNKVIDGGIVPETIQALSNISNKLERMGSSIDNVFKCTCMLADIMDWPEMSKAYKTFFKKEKLPSRSAFAGSGLALKAKIEIECMATLKQ